MNKLMCFSLCFMLLLQFGCSKEERDPCEGVTCLNGGFCFNGGCDCPPERTGLDCSQEAEPTTIIITDVLITRLPANDNGLNWDLLSAPDVEILFYKDGNETVLGQSLIRMNADITQNQLFTGVDFIADSPTESYILRVFDNDQNLTQDDFMGGILFTPYKNGANFPEVIIVDANGVVAFELTLNYEFQ